MTLDFNALRFDPSSKIARSGHVESYFLKLNDPQGRRALWLKATILSNVQSPEGAIAESWAIAFDRDQGHVAVKESGPFSEARFSKEGLDIQAPGLRIQGGSITGTIRHAGRAISVDLSFKEAGEPLAPFPYRAMYEKPFPQSKLVSPHPSVRFSGEYVVDGEKVIVDSWPGMQGHNWGRAHTYHYAWAHCNLWDQDEDFILEGVSARVQLGPIVSPMMTLVCVRYRGVRYDFNRPIDIAQNRASLDNRRWSFEAESDLGRVEGELFGQTDDFVGLYYANPDGKMTYCLNTKLAHARVRFEPRGRLPFTLTSRAAALEIATRDPEHGVRMYV